MRPDQQQLDELVRRIVDAVHPLRIILFGSAARGQMGPESDVDVMVVVPEGTHRRKTAQFLYTQLWGIPFAVDIIVATDEDIRTHADDIGYVYSWALREGVALYAA
jgi:predicted nucleotidyltransferase